MTIKRLLQISILAALLPLESCFTGIESTPRVTGRDVERNNASTTGEQIFARQFVPLSFDRWTPGKRFVVTDSKINLVMSGDTIALGDTIIYKGFSVSPTITGDTASVMRFAVAGRVGAIGSRYRLDLSPSKISRRGPMTIPFTSDLDIVHAVDKALTGNYYYVLSPLWIDTSDGVRGKKYVRVRITGVEAATTDYPVKVSFVSDEGALGALLMTVGNDRGSTRNFDTLFAFNDPYLRYPSISPENWQRIMAGIVAEGMSRDECRLALGTPRDVNKGENGVSLYERWTYDNGVYLIFEDGLLASFRR